MRPLRTHHGHPDIEPITGARWETAPSPRRVELDRDIARQVQIAALTKVVELTAIRVGMDHIGGTPIQEWFDGRKITRSEEVLLALEEIDPEIAAQIHRLIDLCPGNHDGIHQIDELPSVEEGRRGGGRLKCIGTPS